MPSIAAASLTACCRASVAVAQRTFGDLVRSANPPPASPRRRQTPPPSDRSKGRLPSPTAGCGRDSEWNGSASWRTQNRKLRGSGVSGRPAKPPRNPAKGFSSAGSGRDHPRRDRGHLMTNFTKFSLDGCAWAAILAPASGTSRPSRPAPPTGPGAATVDSGDPGCASLTGDSNQERSRRRSRPDARVGFCFPHLLRDSSSPEHHAS